MLVLSKKISEGATPETLRRDFADKEKAAAKKSDSLKSAKAQRILMEYPTINADNWQNVDQLIEAQQITVAQASAESERLQ